MKSFRDVILVDSSVPNFRKPRNDGEFVTECDPLFRYLPGAFWVGLPQKDIAPYGFRHSWCGLVNELTREAISQPYCGC